jgi:hypothetical protein
VVTTTLVTWIVSTLMCSSQQSFLATETQGLHNLMTTRRLDTPLESYREKSKSVSDFVKPKKMWIDTTIEYDGPSRVFPLWNFSNPFPCYESDKQALMSTQPARAGLLFQRPHKTGTTTMVGILMRLAHNRAAGLTPQGKRRQNITWSQVCKHRAMHGTAVSYKYSQRNRQKSFLFSVIRDPTAKAISRFFHFR